MDGMIHLQRSIEGLPQNTEKIYIAYSGGIDSSVLLHALSGYKQQYHLVVWHINHGLQANAASMEAFARKQAARFNLEFRLDQLNMDASAGNQEAKARDQRYRLFEAALSEHDVLMTAHHKNDQAETLLINLLRGSGSAGLRAIARLKSLGKGMLFRPLLDFTRDDVEYYASCHQLEWIEDPSNKALKYDRNYLRHEVLPLIINRWPSAIEQLQRVSELQNESEQLKTDLAQIDYAQARLQKTYTDTSCLSVESLLALSFARRKNLVRYWIKRNKLSVIGFHKMEELLKQLESREDAMPLIEGRDFCIRVYKKNLYLVKHSGGSSPEPVYDMPDTGKLDIPAIGFYQSREDIFHYLKRADEGQSVSLHFRQSDHTGRAQLHAHRLKRLYQKHQIPPWIRSSIPQIYLNDELLGLWLV